MPRRLGRGGALGGGISVVIPARDEAASIGAAAGLAAGRARGGRGRRPLDRRDRRGRRRGGRAGGRVAPLPDGWTGKSWACAQGVGATTGESVVFVDADVRFAPGGLAAVVTAHQDRGGLVSVQPFHEPGAPLESLAAVFNIVAVAGTDAATPLGRRLGVRGAFGPVLATTRADYDRVGGHEAVRSSVVDDVALADRYRAAGRPVSVFGGGDAVAFRMYPAGLGQLVEGFTKNMAAGAGGVRRSTVLLVVRGSHCWCRPPPLLPSPCCGARGWRPPWRSIWYAGSAGGWDAGSGASAGGPAAFPVSVALFLGVFARSVGASATGSVSWRGRRGRRLAGVVEQSLAVVLQLRHRLADVVEGAVAAGLGGRGPHDVGAQRRPSSLRVETSTLR